MYDANWAVNFFFIVISVSKGGDSIVGGQQLHWSFERNSWRIQQPTVKIQKNE